MRQEGREEGNGLRVGQRDHKAAPEMHVPARSGRGAVGAGVTPRLDAEPDQIGSADPAQDVEQDGCVLEHPAQAEGDGGQQNGVAQRRARDRGQGGADPLARPSRDNQGYDRARSDDENRSDQQKGSEQFPVHGAPVRPC